MNTLEAIKSRRSIRRFLDKPVSREDLETVIQAAAWAPSAKNSQTWRFTVVQGDKLKEMLDLFKGGIIGRESEGEDTGSSKWTLEVMRQAPVAVLIHNTDGIHPWKARKEHESWWDLATVQSVGAAIQNLLLAAHELGLGSLWIADIWEAYPCLNEWLGVDTQLVAAVSLGTPDVDPPMPPRKPMDEIVTWLG